MRWWVQHRRVLGIGVSVLLLGTVTAGGVAATQSTASFKMIVSGGAAQCLPHATASVGIVPAGPTEVMTVNVSGLPPKTDFDLFVIQVPTAPFGVAWYLGDIQTNNNGQAGETFIGRFNAETFVVSPGAITPPQVHTDGMFPDATEGVSFRPIHTYHLGLWFNSTADAASAGCPTTESPFNGEHAAGIQVLNTNNFPIEEGPLLALTS
jgi:hypothetical protein